MPTNEALVDMLAEAALRLNRHQDLSQLLHDVVDICLDAVGADACFVYLYEQGDLVLRASSNAHPAEVGRLRMRIGEGITGWVAQQRRPVALSEKATSDARFKFYSALPEDCFEAFLSVPILFRNQVLGVVNLQHRDVHTHAPAEIKAVQTIGLMLGEALDREHKVVANQQWEERFGGLGTLLEVAAENGAAGLSRTLAKLAGLLPLRAATVLLAREKEPRLFHFTQPGEPPLAIAATALEAMESAAAPILQPQTENAVEAASEWLCPLRAPSGMLGCLALRLAGEVADAAMVPLAARVLAGALEADDLRGRCSDQQEALAARKLIERAKGLLQKEQKISEDEAYRLLQQESRRNRRSMAAVAQALLTSRELRGDLSGVVAGEDAEAS